MLKKIFFSLFMFLIVITLINFSFNNDILALNKEKKFTLSLKKTIDFALQNSEEIKLKKNEIIKNEYLLKKEKSAIFPNITADITWKYNPKLLQTKVEIPNMPAMDFATGSKYEFQAGITLKQAIYTFGIVNTAIKAAKEFIDISNLDREQSEKDIIQKAKLSYYATLLAKRNFEIAKESYKNAQNNKNLISNNFSIERASRGDNIKLAADVAQRLPILKNAEINYLLSLQNLKNITNLSQYQHQQITLIDELNKNFIPQDFQELSQKLIKKELKFKMLEKKIKLNSQLAKLEKASFKPRISLFASYNWVSLSEDSIMDQENMQNVSTIGINFSIPLWDGNKASSAYQRAMIEKNNSEILLLKAQKNLKLLLNSLVSQFNLLIDVYESNKKAKKLAAKAYKLTSDRYRIGKTSSSELNDTELMLTKSKLDELLTLYNLNIIKTKITTLTSELKEIKEIKEIK